MKLGVALVSLFKELIWKGGEMSEMGVQGGVHDVKFTHTHKPGF